MMIYVCLCLICLFLCVCVPYVRAQNMVGGCSYTVSACVCLSPSLSDISLACTWLWRQGDGKHAGSGNYGGSRHFSWMISFGTAEEQAKTGGRRMSCEREKGGGEAAMKGKAFPGIKGGGWWKEKDSRGDKRVRVSLGGDQEEEQVLWSVLRSSLRGGKECMKTGRRRESSLGGQGRKRGEHEG